MAEARWMPADAWLALMERDDDRMPSYQLGPVPALEVPKGNGGRRRHMTDSEFRAAADLARSIGVRPAAQQLGVSHAALIRGWSRRQIEVEPPSGRRR